MTEKNTMPAGLKKVSTMQTAIVTLAGAAGVAAIAFSGSLGPGPKTDPATDTQSAPVEAICIRADITLIEGLAPGCLTRERLMALGDGRVMAALDQPVTVSLTHPDDASKPLEIVRTCAEWRRLKNQSYFALSNRELRREAFFVRACGALDMLEQARVPQVSWFDGGAMSERDLRDLARPGQLPAFGEGTQGDASADPGTESFDSTDITESTPDVPTPATSADIRQTADGEWRLSAPDTEIVMQEIAHADFNGDGIGDILVFMSVMPAGGTAQLSQLGLVERTDRSANCQFTPIARP